MSAFQERWLSSRTRSYVFRATESPHFQHEEMERAMKNVLVSALSIVAGVAITSTAAAEIPHEHDNMKSLIELAELNPTDADIRVRIGSLYRMQGNDAAAQPWLAEAIELDPSLGDLSDAGEAYDQDIVIRGSSGPDVWVCTLPGIANYGQADGFYAYAVATTSANMGDVTLDWFPEPSNQHPVIGQNLYQWYQGRFRQVGQSWLKHGFCALQNSGCGSCMPAGGGCPPLLGPGCADPYSSGLNGTQGRLGPKHEVNPTTGNFPGNHARPSGSNANRGRLLVPAADAIPTNSGAQYWVEGQYIHPDDSHSSADTSLNNATHASTTMSSSGARQLSFPSSTFQQEPAIMSWQRVDPSVQIEVVEADGYIYVGGSATDQGDGTYLYQYNIFNLDSNNGVDTLTVNAAGAVNASDADYHSPGWHSGSTYNNTPWTNAARGSEMVFSVDDPGVNDNRVRWATMYSFTFVADSAPEDGTVTINVPGTGEFEVNMPVPQGSSCVGDFDGNSTVDATDLATLIAAWGTPAADLNGDGTTDAGDLAVLIAAWGPC